jgi:hypothetical protein
MAPGASGLARPPRSHPPPGRAGIENKKVRLQKRIRALRHRRRRLPMRDRLRQRHRLVEIGMKVKGK